MDLATTKVWQSTIYTHDTEAEWVDSRDRLGVGASEVAALIGFDVSYKGQSIITVFASKTGVREEFSESVKTLFRRGHEMEPIIAREFQIATGLECFDPGEYTIFANPEIEFLFATLDRFVVHPDHGPIPVELKNVGWQCRKDWEGDRPVLKYEVQCQAQMAVTGTTHCYLVGYVGGNDLVIFLIERSQRFIDSMVKVVHDFWGYVQRRELPPVDESKATKDALKLIYPQDSGVEVDLPVEFIALDRDLIQIKEDIKLLDVRKDAIENKIKAAIGEATIGTLPTGYYKWKTQHNAGYVVAPFTKRVLTRSKK